MAATDPEITGVWSEQAFSEYYGNDGAMYQAAILEQYKVAVEMADRVSARRVMSNTFFLTLNTVVITIVGLVWRNRPNGDAWLLALPLAILLAQCYGWFRLMKSYRQLNSAKLHVVGVLEERLPASPFWSGEWEALGRGKARGGYVPLTQTERWVPVLFGVTYVVAFVLALTSS